MHLIRPNSAIVKLLQNSSNLFRSNFHATNRGYVIPLLNNNILQVRKCSTSFKTGESKLENVYYGLLTPQIKGVKIISFSTSIGGICAQPILIKHISAMEGGLPIIISLCGFVGFFTFVTPFLLHIVTKKYITTMEYNSETDKYIATTLSFFCLPKKIEFSADDVVVPDVPGMFTSFKVKDIPVFVDPTLFKNAYHYGKLMGYHKPIDLKLSNSNESDNKQNS